MPLEQSMIAHACLKPFRSPCKSIRILSDPLAKASVSTMIRIKVSRAQVSHRTRSTNGLRMVDPKSARDVRYWTVKNRIFTYIKSVLFYEYIPYGNLRHGYAFYMQLSGVPVTVYYFWGFFRVRIQKRIGFFQGPPVSSTSHP